MERGETHARTIHDVVFETSSFVTEQSNWLFQYNDAVIRELPSAQSGPIQMGSDDRDGHTNLSATFDERLPI